jgi:hypothetical protein
MCGSILLNFCLYLFYDVFFFSFFRFGPDKKRAILNNVLFACTPVTSGCAGSTCVSGIMTKIQTAAKKVTTIPNIPFTIVSRQFGITSASLSATYVGLLSISKCE